MNIFWIDKEGVFPPENSQFGYCLFSENTPSPPLQSVTQMHNLPEPLKEPIRVIRHSVLPTKSQWMENVKTTTQVIDQKGLEKAVLARCCILECETTPSPFAIAATLLSISKNSTVFCFANEQMAFVGASPEILFHRRGRMIQTEAVAGTSPRGKTEEEDLILEKELLENVKARKEIVPVQTFLQNNLGPLCTSPLSFSDIHTKKTPNVQHLCSKAHGILQEHVSDFDILRSIHPTPALCGSPQENARTWIHHVEPFERGLYGGTLGWSTPEESVWIVAIRCCLIQQNIVKLYTGAGIVEGSDPKHEWEELNHKMDLYKNIFTLPNIE